MDFSQVYTNHWPIVFHVCRKLMRNFHDAEDLAQTTFLRAWQAFARLQPGFVSAWLCRIATNGALDEFRRRGRQGEHVPLVELRETHDSQVTYERAFAFDPDFELLRNAEHDYQEASESAMHWISQLSQVDQQILDMAFFRSRTNREIANDLRLPLHTVKNHRYRALMHLRELARG